MAQNGYEDTDRHGAHHDGEDPADEHLDLLTDGDPDQELPSKRRRWPWVVGLVGALVVGGVVGTAVPAEPEVVTETETVTEVVEVEIEVDPEDLEERREDVEARAGELDELSDELDTRDEDLDTREDGLDTRGEELDTFESDLDDREEEINARETEIEDNTIPGSGTFLVGDEIEPGTYRSDGNGSGECMWARLSGLSGDYSDHVAEGFPDGPAYVTIAESDAAFETSRCGDWIPEE